MTFGSSISRFIKYLLLVLFSLILVIIGYVLSGSTIKGKVLEEFSNKPIPNATVTIGKKRAISDKNGNFSLKIKAGNQLLSILASGYEEYKSILNIPYLVPQDLKIIRLKNGIIVGKLIENYPRPQEINKAVLSVGGKRQIVNSQDTFKITGIPIGKQTLRIENLEDYEPYQNSISVQAGENSVTLALSPSIDEVAKRFAQAYKFNDWDLVYDLLHPDSQIKKKTIEIFVNERSDLLKKENAQGLYLDNVTTHKHTLLSSWKSNSGKVYKNVALVRFNFKWEISDSNKARQDNKNYNGYFVKHSDGWKIIILQFEESESKNSVTSKSFKNPKDLVLIKSEMIDLNGIGFLTLVASIKNMSNKFFSDVYANFNLYDEKGNLVDTYIANIQNLEPHKTWKIEYPDLGGKGSKTAKLINITAK